MKKLQITVCMLVILPLLVVTLVGCTKAPTLTIREPASGTTVTKAEITVRGTVSDTKAVVTINGVKVSVTNNCTFSKKLTLKEGQNTIKVVAIRGKKSATKTVTVTYAPPPTLSLEISTPEDEAALTESPVIVSGTVSDSGATVTVNDVEIEVGQDGTFSAEVELTEGENVITVTATLGDLTATKTVTVTYAPPPALSLEISTPEDEAALTESPLVVSGTVSDSGATVTVNNVEIEVGQDGTFSAEVELTEGENVITVTATLGDLTATKTLTVLYEPEQEVE